MLLTLKMVGLALEVSETSQTKRKLTAPDCKDEEKPELQLSLQFRGVKPSFIDVIHYAFSHVGILTGKFTLKLSFSFIIQLILLCNQGHIINFGLIGT